MSVRYKGQKPCKGQLQVKRCDLHYATIKVPHHPRNGTVEFSGPLNDLGTSLYMVTKKHDLPLAGDVRGILGGVYLAAQDLLESTATISQTDHLWQLDTSGTLAEDSINFFNQSNMYTDTWKDPTPQVIAALQKNMFRTALSVKNESSRYLDKNIGYHSVHMPQSVNAVNMDT